jgi:FMN phosphatase YigB (HAD superfamily)
MRGEYTAEDITHRIGKDIDVSADELLTGLRKSCEQMKLFNKQIIPAIKSLRRSGVKVVLATDNMDTFMRWTVPALKLKRHFDAILDSYSLQALKRDKDESGQSKFFGKFFDENMIDPMSTVLIDDGMHNVIVKDFGMGFIHLSPDSPVHSVLMSLNKA